MTTQGSRERVLGARLVQPDQRTCGPSALVVARMLNDPEYAERVLADGSFRDEVLRLHRRANIVWPRALGTTPWAAARLMGHGCGLPGARYRAHTIAGRRDLAYIAASHAVRAGHVVPIYLGSRWLPRHVVLAVAHDQGGLHVYDPASGRVLPMPAAAFVSGSLAIAGWSRPWLVVTPRRA
jgi:hypothetical protein